MNTNETVQGPAPTPEEISRVAAHTGRQAAGVPKRYSAEELAKRTERIKAASAVHRGVTEIAKGKVTIVQVARGILRRND